MSPALASATCESVADGASGVRFRNPWPEILQRAQGALLGLAVGDALGGPVEFLTRSEVRARHGELCDMVGGGWLALRAGQVTDDTQMAACIARSIDASGWSPTDVAERFAGWLKSRPLDVGATCRRGIRRYIVHGTVHGSPNPGDAGNGAAMRMAPVAIATLGDDSLLERWSLDQAHITHHHPLSDAACLLVGRLVHRACRGEPLSTLRRIALETVGRFPTMQFEPYRGQSSAYVVDTMQTVLHHLFATTNFETCLIRTVNVGGDADTTGAIAGTIAGAYYGLRAIPRRWMRKLDRTLREELLGLAERLAARSPLARSLGVEP